MTEDGRSLQHSVSDPERDPVTTWWRNPVWPAAILVAVVFLALWRFTFEGDITGFFRIGENRPLSPYMDPARCRVVDGEVGYDGQMFLAIAMDPTARSPETIRTLDNPAYRMRRILYPVAAFLLSGGVRRFIPYALVLINGMCLVALVSMIGRYVRAKGAQEPAGLAVLFLPGSWVVFTLSTADLLAETLFVGAVLAWRGSRWAWVALLLALAALARDTMLLMIAGFAFCAATTGAWRRAAFLGLAAFPALVWGGLCDACWGASSLPRSPWDWFTWPGAGLLEKVCQLAAGGIEPKAVFEAGAFLFTLALPIPIAGAAGRLWREDRPVLVAAALQTMLFLCSRQTLLGYYIDYLRVFLGLQYLFALAVPAMSAPARRMVLGLSVLLSVTYVLAYTGGRI